jgi:4-oxalocrotonate tautomerase
VEVPVSRKHCGLKLEGDLDRVDSDVEFAEANRVARGTLEHVQPLTLQRGDGVPYDPGSCIEFSHGRRKEASAGEGSSLHQRNVAVAEGVKCRDTRRVSQAWKDHMVDVDLSCVLDGGELQVLLRAEVSEQAALAHVESRGKPAESQPLKPLDARNRRRDLEDPLLGGVAARSLGGHKPCIARTVVLCCATSSDRSVVLFTEVATMPLVNVKVIEGVFNESQKRDMIRRLTDTMVDIEGEALRPVTWVVVEEVKSGDWGIAGNPLTTSDVKALAAGQPVG